MGRITALTKASLNDQPEVRTFARSPAMLDE